MDTFSAIKARQAVKHYDADFAMLKRDIDKLLEYAIEAPTSFNLFGFDSSKLCFVNFILGE